MIDSLQNKEVEQQPQQQESPQFSINYNYPNLENRNQVEEKGVQQPSRRSANRDQSSQVKSRSVHLQNHKDRSHSPKITGFLENLQLITAQKSRPSPQQIPFIEENDNISALRLGSEPILNNLRHQLQASDVQQVDLQKENLKIFSQLQQARSQLAEEQNKVAELKRGHIKLEDLAQKLQQIAIQERQRASKLELELINQSSRKQNRVSNTQNRMESTFEQEMSVQMANLLKENSSLRDSVHSLEKKVQEGFECSISTMGHLLDCAGDTWKSLVCTMKKEVYSSLVQGSNLLKRLGLESKIEDLLHQQRSKPQQMDGSQREPKVFKKIVFSRKRPPSHYALSHNGAVEPQRRQSKVAGMLDFLSDSGSELDNTQTLHNADFRIYK